MSCISVVYHWLQYITFVCYHKPVLTGQTKLITTMGVSSLLTLSICPCFNAVGLPHSQWPLRSHLKAQKCRVYKYIVNGTVVFTLSREACGNELCSLIFSYQLNEKGCEIEGDRNKTASGWETETMKVTCSQEQVSAVPCTPYWLACLGEYGLENDNCTALSPLFHWQKPTFKWTQVAKLQTNFHHCCTLSDSSHFFILGQP